MGWLREFRSSLENPQTPLTYPAEWLLDIFNGGRTDAGVRVSELQALQVSTGYACVDLISGSLAAVPFNVYELLKPRGKRIAIEQDTHWLLHDEPNPEMTGFTFRKTLQVHALLWTNAYAEIERDGANRPVALWPLDPSRTRPKRALQKMSWRNSGGTLVTIEPGQTFYEATLPMPDQKTGESVYRIAGEDILHVPGLSLDGRIGQSTVWLMRQVFGLALAAEKFGSKFFANGLRPSGVVEVPADLSAPAIENFKRSMMESYGGENQHRPLVIEAGMKWTKSDTTPNDAQFLETREHQRNEIAAVFHVPPHMVGDTKNTNRATAEQIAIEFVQYTLKPWVQPWVQETSRKLFPRRGRNANKYVTGFDLQDLLMPDSESRGKYIALLKQWGVASTNDIREFIDWNPVEEQWADKCWKPVNMADADAPPPSPTEPEPPESGMPAKEGDDAESLRYTDAYRALFMRAWHSVLGFKKLDSAAFYRHFGALLEGIAGGIEMNAAPFMGVEAGASPSPEMANLLRDYCDGLFKRLADADPEKELQRAVRTLKVTVYRDLAGRKAKQEEAKFEGVNQ